MPKENVQFVTIIPVLDSSKIASLMNSTMTEIGRSSGDAMGVSMVAALQSKLTAASASIASTVSGITSQSTSAMMDSMGKASSSNSFTRSAEPCYWST